MKRLVFLAVVMGVAALLVLPGRGEWPATYTVRPGDTLAGIAARYGTTVEELVALNRDRYPSLAERPDLIRVGWVLRLPGGGNAPERLLAWADAMVREATTFEPTPTPTPPPLPFSDPAQVDAWRKEVIRLANVERAKVGAPPVEEDPGLDEIAAARVRDMVERHYYSHYDPQTGEYLAGKMCEEMYGTYCAELGLFSLPSVAPPRRAIQAWLGSPGHRAHLLEARYRKVGAAVAVGPVRYDGRLYSRAAVAVIIFR